MILSLLRNNIGREQEIVSDCKVNAKYYYAAIYNKYQRMVTTS